MDRNSLPEALLYAVKNYLGITWEDEGTDANVSGFIASGMAYLDKKLGEKGDYEVDGLPRTLLLEYARYARDSALDVFENNYSSMILAMQNDRKVSAFELESAVPPQG